MPFSIQTAHMPCLSKKNNLTGVYPITERPPSRGAHSPSHGPSAAFSMTSGHKNSILTAKMELRQSPWINPWHGKLKSHSYQVPKF